jgi:hypothetical protein
LKVICGQGRVSVRALACPVFAYTSGREQNAKEKRKQAREILGFFLSCKSGK